MALTWRDYKHQEAVVGGQHKQFQGLIPGTTRKGSEGDLGQALGSLPRVLWSLMSGTMPEVQGIVSFPNEMAVASYCLGKMFTK